MTQPKFQPHPGSQQAFLSCPVAEALYSGTRGTGTTTALLMDFAQHVGMGLKEDWRGILFRRRFPDLQIIVEAANKWFPRNFPTAEYNKSSRTWTFEDGEQLILDFMEKEEDYYYKHHGHAYQWIGWDQLTSWPTDTLFKKMLSTSRSYNRDAPKKVRAACNPYGPGSDWVKDRYQLPIHQDHVATPIIRTTGGYDRVAVHGSFHENTSLLSRQPRYEDALTNACDSPEMEAAWVHGIWGWSHADYLREIELKAAQQAAWIESVRPV